MNPEQDRQNRLASLHGWLKGQIESGVLDFSTIVVAPGKMIRFVNSYPSYLSAENAMLFRVVMEARKRYGVSMITAKDYAGIVVDGLKEMIDGRFVRSVTTIGENSC